MAPAARLQSFSAGRMVRQGWLRVMVVLQGVSLHCDVLEGLPRAAWSVTVASSAVDDLENTQSADDVSMPCPC